MQPTFCEALAQLVTALTFAYLAADEQTVYHANAEAEAAWRAAMHHINTRAGITVPTHEGAHDDDRILAPVG